ncbi:raffinose/stachyose/melibiose transport system permease protein [Devosia enhydra]|uniref:sn-glycerol-3-phosphate transport system permease protein UgpE n=1 Tax=Devosia enhydra TaxID=665118 RepID=A0A1K2HXV5_9HYPH|nr:carbohydrate ABC transporter permease [Devosia enhydra]SFZ84634.1 raffinose/stachyose/melibiose transport system permease protein [Devosia enhydra]
MESTRYRPLAAVREVLFILLALVWCIPFYYLAIVAVKPDMEVFTAPMSFPSTIVLGNFAEAWRGTGGVGLGEALLNSVIVTVGTVSLLIFLGSLTAYVIARNTQRIGGLLYVFFVVGIILPYQMAIVPLFSSLRSLGLVGNQIGMIVLFTGLLLPMAVFLYAGFMRALPHDYEEAAQVDGAGRGKIFFRIVFPLLRPVTATVAIMTGMIVWNDFFLQLIFLNGSSAQTLPVAMYGFVGEFTARWNMVFAAVCISIAPILAFYLFAQRRFMQGFTGGIKS